MSQVTYAQERRKRGRSPLIGLVFVAIAVIAILVGRNFTSFGDMLASSPFSGGGDDAGSPGHGGDVVTIEAVIGSEKRPYFEDERVREVLAEHGYVVNVDTAGSRAIATGVNLDDYDLAFPSSSPAAEKIANDNQNFGMETPFHSPMAIASFDSIITVLETEDVAYQMGDAWYIDMEDYMELAKSGTRWRDLSTTYPSPRTVSISSTDIRTSNSAAMYLSILAWTANGGKVPAAGDVAEVAREITPAFTTQGYTDGSSAGPFSDYLAQGIGSRPMVMIYEAQYLGEQMKENSRINESMVLAYPDPTVVSKHTTVALTEEGAEVARLLATDQQLQRLAAEHGFRPQNQRQFDEVLKEYRLDATNIYHYSVDPPAYDQLEALIELVGAQYASPPVEEEEE